MAEDRVFKLRVRYAKSGRLAMLSHLELARALERVIRRAGLPYAVSSGFSPHMKIAFGAALPVGVGSTCEVFDVALTSYVAPEKALAKLQRMAPDDLMPYDAHYLEAGAPAASVAFPVSVYRAIIDWGCLQVPNEISVPATITVERKKGDKTYRVSDYLVQAPAFVISSDALSSCTTTAVEFSLRILQSGALRPDTFIRKCIDISTNEYDDDFMHKNGINKPIVQSLLRVGQREG